MQKARRGGTTRIVCNAKRKKMQKLPMRYVNSIRCGILLPCVGSDRRGLGEEERGSADQVP